MFDYIAVRVILILLGWYYLSNFIMALMGKVVTWFKAPKAKDSTRYLDEYAIESDNTDEVDTRDIVINDLEIPEYMSKKINRAKRKRS